MLINDQVQKQILPMMVKATGIVSASDAEQRSAATLQLNPGQAVKAEIIATLPNHLYLARIAGEMFKIELPILVQPGKIMDLTVVSAEPKVVFQFTPAGPGSEPVRLTSLGKWLSATLKDAPSLPAAGALLETPQQGAALLAQRLKAAIVQSGLFYESHLAKWSAGLLQLNELLEEPQGRLSKAAGPAADDEAAEAAHSQDFADASTHSLVKQQLMLLNAGMLTWKGEAWPGQKVELSIDPEKGELGETETEATLSVDLPHLGTVLAKLVFGSQGLSVEFVCEDSESSGELREGALELRSALSSSGLLLEHMAVRDHEKTAA